MTGILWAVVQEPIALPARYCCGKPHHITLAYGVERETVEELIGLPLTVGAIQESWNDRVQAIEVVLPSWVPCQNPHPHISVSWVHDAAPVEANVMLANEHKFASLEFDHIVTVIEFQEWGETKPQCPHCRSRELVKMGKTISDRQRWKCKVCGRTTVFPFSTRFN